MSIYFNAATTILGSEKRSEAYLEGYAVALQAQHCEELHDTVNAPDVRYNPYPFPSAENDAFSAGVDRGTNAWKFLAVKLVVRGACSA